MLIRRLLPRTGDSFVIPIAANLRCLYNGQDAGANPYAIGEGLSSDGGLVWTRVGTTPVFVAAGAGYMSAHVKDPWLMADGLSAYFSGYDGSHYQGGHMTRALLTDTFTADSTTVPAIALGGGGSPDEHGVAFLTVLHEPADTGKEYKVWWRGEDATGKQTVCYGYSSNADLSGLTRIGRVLDVGAGGQWDAIGVFPCAIYKSGSTYYLYYGGRKNVSAPVNWQGGYATFTDPEGTYTRGGGNPTLTVGSAVAGNSQALTSDTTAGSAIVHVTTTSHWTQGEAMVIAAGSVVTEEHTIASIDSGTQVTLNAAVSSTFATADGAVLRPFNENSVTPRTILPYASSFAMFLAAFQPVDDLTVTGETLWEGSERATSSTLTGAWTYDDSVGLLFQLSPGYTGWAKFSSENPSVIVAP